MYLEGNVTQFGNIENEVITAATMSSTRDVILGVSVIGGIHINAGRPNWRVFDFPCFQT